ncbi:MAG: hypothetical protein PUC40_07485 [Lachnospiraceae bacterium]|nr:hypothetical protein [Lachnospiraceae bacterium]MDD6380896.1 hypothetical protein [Lachnospiraceae bacterium]
MKAQPIETLFNDYLQRSGNQSEQEKERERKFTEINNLLEKEGDKGEKILEKVADLQYESLRAGFYAGMETATNYMIELEQIGKGKSEVVRE